MRPTLQPRCVGSSWLEDPCKRLWIGVDLDQPLQVTTKGFSFYATFITSTEGSGVLEARRYVYASTFPEVCSRRASL